MIVKLSFEWIGDEYFCELSESVSGSSTTFGAATKAEAWDFARAWLSIDFQGEEEE